MIKIEHSIFKDKDELIFHVLGDYYGILRAVDDYESPHLSKILNTCINYLNNKEYSSVNAVDEHGNTFLHYSNSIRDHKITIDLLKNGADPLIENKKKQNAFQYKASQSSVNLLSKHIEKLNIQHIEDLKKHNYHLNFKQVTFDNLIDDYFFVSPFLSYEYAKIKDKLKEYNLDNITNLTKIIFNDFMLNNLHPIKKDKDNEPTFHTPTENVIKIKKLLLEDLTVENNSFIHYLILKNYTNIVKKLSDYEIKDINKVFFDFATLSQFENNSYFKNGLTYLTTSDPLNSDKKKQKLQFFINDFVANYSHIILDNIIKNNISIEQKEGPSPFSKSIKDHVFNNFPDLASIYHYLYLQKNLTNEALIAKSKRNKL